MKELMLTKSFISYFSTLMELLYGPSTAFIKIYDNRKGYLSKSLMFASISIILSFGMLVLASHSSILNIKFDWHSVVKNVIFIPLQLTILVPLLSGYIHFLAKIFKGEGTVKDSAVLVFYSYALAPYATSLLVIFLYIEKLMGYPVSLQPPSDPILRTIEYIIEGTLLINGCYILSRGIQVAYRVKMNRAIIIVISMAITTIMCGYFVASLTNKIYFS